MHVAVRVLLLALLAPCFITPAPRAAEMRVAVAANFTDPARAIAVAFEKATRHKLVMSFGATGQLYAQITQGAPFEVFLAADQATPAKAIAEGHAVKGTALTYAVGKLVLFSRTQGFVEGQDTLRTSRFNRLAIANPAVAPYGSAAIEVMRRLGVWEALRPRIVQGQNIAQTLQFVETGNAELGFVALAQVGPAEGGSRWVVPGDLHTPILQDAVLLKPADRNAAARAFLEYLAGREARGLIERSGYGLVD